MKSCYPFVNTPLPYAYDALEPFIDTKTMHLHHDKHLQTYIDNLNAALKDNPTLQKWCLEELVMNWKKLPQCLQTPIRNNSGGVYNHRFYFEGLNPPRPIPRNHLLKEIEEQFQGFDAFKAIFKKTALSVFGSGYAWLMADRGMLKITATCNQDVPDIQTMTPVFNVDVWEHAYYLKHYNLRGDYIDDWFFVINWEKAEEQWNAQFLQ